MFAIRKPSSLWAETDCIYGFRREGHRHPLGLRLSEDLGLSTRKCSPGQSGVCRGSPPSACASPRFRPVRGGGAPSSSPPWLRSISSRVEAPHTLFEILQRRFISSPSFIDSIIYLKQHGLGLDFKLHSNTASPMLLKCGGQEGSFRGSRVLWTCLHHGGMMGLDCVLALASFLAPQDAPVSYSLPPFCN